MYVCMRVCACECVCMRACVSVLTLAAQEEEQTKQREEEDKHWTKALSGELSGPRKAAIGAAQNVTEVVNTVT